MGKAVAKKGDQVVGMDTHIVLVTSPGGPVPTPLPFAFSGQLAQDLASSVFIDGKPVALVGSRAPNQPAHIPIGGPFQAQPKDEGKVAEGSTTVFADDRGVARDADPCQCCNDPVDQRTGHIIATGTVLAD